MINEYINEVNFRRYIENLREFNRERGYRNPRHDLVDMLIDMYFDEMDMEFFPLNCAFVEDRQLYFNDVKRILGECFLNEHTRFLENDFTDVQREVYTSKLLIWCSGNITKYQDITTAFIMINWLLYKYSSRNSTGRVNRWTRVLARSMSLDNRRLPLTHLENGLRVIGEELPQGEPLCETVDVLTCCMILGLPRTILNREEYAKVWVNCLTPYFD